MFGSASGTTVFTGSQAVQSGGIAASTTVKNGGTVAVHSDASVTGIVFSGGALELVGAGASAPGVTLSRGAYLEFASGAMLPTATAVLSSRKRNRSNYRCSHIQKRDEVGCWPVASSAALQRYVRSWNTSRHGADIVNVRLQHSSCLGIGLRALRHSLAMLAAMRRAGPPPLARRSDLR